VRIKWAILAEGVTQDARGALAAIGVGQAVLSAAALPVQAKRAMIVLITGEKEEFAEGRHISFSASMIGPSGKTLAVQTGQMPLGPLPWPDLPFGLNLASELAFPATEYGRYEVRVSAQSGDEDLSVEEEFFIVPPLTAT